LNFPLNDKEKMEIRNEEFAINSLIYNQQQVIIIDSKVVGFQIVHILYFETHTRILLKFQQISLILTSLLNVTQPRRK